MKKWRVGKVKMIQLISYLLISLVIGGALILASFLLAPVEIKGHKQLAYECGFDTVDMPGKSFDVQYFITALLFLTLDLEITLCFPLSVIIGDCSFEGLIGSFIFFVIFTVAYITEWINGAFS